MTDRLLNIGKQFELARLTIDGGQRGFKEGNEELGLKLGRVRPRPFLLPLIVLLDDIGDGPTLTSVIDRVNQDTSARRGCIIALKQGIDDISHCIGIKLGQQAFDRV